MRKPSAEASNATRASAKPQRMARGASYHVRGLACRCIHGAKYMGLTPELSGQ